LTASFIDSILRDIITGQFLFCSFQDVIGVAFTNFVHMEDRYSMFNLIPQNEADMIGCTHAGHVIINPEQHVSASELRISAYPDRNGYFPINDFVGCTQSAVNPSMEGRLLTGCLPSNKDQAAYSTTLAIPQNSPAITSVLRMPAQQSGQEPTNNMFSGVGRPQQPHSFMAFSFAKLKKSSFTTIHSRQHILEGGGRKAVPPTLHYAAMLELLPADVGHRLRGRSGRIAVSLGARKRDGIRIVKVRG
jgi:hypothetical protein